MRLAIGTILGFISVAFGAYFDHGLKPHLSLQAVDSMSTALRYNQVYAILISVIALIQYSNAKLSQNLLLTISQWLFISGTIIFCFSIYSATLLTNKSYLSLTPIGGSIIMLAWLTLMLTSIVMVIRRFQE